jgi:hypothetical protein
MRTPLLTSLVLVAALAPAAAASTRATAIAHPTAATQVVLRVTTGGGFVAPSTNLRTLPSFTLYGDGTIIVPGVVPQISPGPAIYPLVRSTLSEQEVQALLKRATKAGLLARRAIDYGNMGTVGISDAPTTTLLVHAGGRTVVREAYALGIDPGSGRMPAPTARARKALARFIATLPHGHARAPYAPRALAVYVGPFRGPGSGRAVWPLARPLASAGKPVASELGYRCVTVAGTAAKTLLPTLRRANEQSRWVARPGAKQAFQLFARPSLPDEHGCI